MFSSSPNYTKLKTHLRLAINRLKLLEKKKTELTQKARKEIADYIQIGKYERAKIRVEHIIREDYLVEAMEIVEMYCDLVLARFGLVTQMKTLDDGIAEAISTLIWVAPRLQSDVQELKIISDIFSAKYGKQYSEACRTEQDKTISEKLMHKLSIQSPPKILVERYMIEIAKNYNIHYEPDPEIMKEEPSGMLDTFLIDLSDKNNLGGGGGAPQPLGFIGYPQAPLLPPMNDALPGPAPFSYPAQQPQDNGASAPPPGGSAPYMPYGAPFSYNIPPAVAESKEQNINVDNLPPYDSTSPDDNLQNKGMAPKPQPRSKFPGTNADYPELPDLPSVPSDNFQNSSTSISKNDEIDFDDLTRRFEELKKKK